MKEEKRDIDEEVCARSTCLFVVLKKTIGL
jgi:hypothetical protein